MIHRRTYHQLELVKVHHGPYPPLLAKVVPQGRRVKGECVNVVGEHLAVLLELLLHALCGSLAMTSGMVIVFHDLVEAGTKSLVTRQVAPCEVQVSLDTVIVRNIESK